MEVVVRLRLALIVLSACGTRISLGELDARGTTPDGPAEVADDAQADDGHRDAQAIDSAPDVAVACLLTTPQPGPCATDAVPVCGCDGVTYSNACTALKYVTTYTSGTCPCAPVTPSVMACPGVFDPVCGCDGKTYGNACKAALSVSSSTPGACK